MNPHDEEPTEPSVRLADYFRDRGPSSPWSMPARLESTVPADEDETIDFEGAIESLTHTLSLEFEDF